MKRIGIIFKLLLVAGSLQAQYSYTPPAINTNDSGITFDQVMSAMEMTLSPGDTGEGGKRHRLEEFNRFWGKRVSHNESSSDNMFKQYLHNLQLDRIAKTTGGNACSGSGYQGAWKCLGPDESPYQNLGRAEDVWAWNNPNNPHDTSYLLLATFGGLFKSVNAGQTWQCITDNSPLTGGVLSPVSIAVNPLNKNQIYLGTGITGGAEWHVIYSQTGYMGPNLSYGGGIIYSHDGGQTWQQDIIQREATPSWGDSLELVQKVFFSPDGSKLFAFVFNHLYYKNFPSGNWNRIYSVPLNSPTPFISYAFIPGSNTDFFASVSHIAMNDFPETSILRFQYANNTYSWIKVPNLPDWELNTTNVMHCYISPKNTRFHICFFKR